MVSVEVSGSVPLTAVQRERLAELADALIAATALESGLTVLTGNTKHFVPIAGLEVESFEPA